MKPLNAAAVGFLVGVTAMWFGGDKLKALASGDACGCPNPAREPKLCAPSPSVHVGGNGVTGKDFVAVLRRRA